MNIHYSTRNNPECVLRPLAPQLEGKDRIEDYGPSAYTLTVCDYDLQGVFQVLVYFHNGSLVSAPVTIIGCCIGY